MKKIIFILAAAMLAVACNKDEREQRSDILVYALCRMDINGKPQAKAVDVVGDSAAVHELSRYMYGYNGMLVNYGLGDFIFNGPTNVTFTDSWTPEFYQRDTINHTFSFTNDAVINWMKKNTVDGEFVGGVDGTEYLGYVVCMENFVFCAAYDACAENGVVCGAGEEKQYYDPVTSTEADFDEFVGFHYIGYDTLGYAPNSQMRANRAYLQSLLDKRKYQEMLDYFKTSYHIYTCTGEEYRELVRLGIN